MTRASRTIITLAPHEPGVSLLSVPADMNDEMGKIGFARLVPGVGYLILDEHLPALRRHADRLAWSLVDTSTHTPGPGMPNPLPECRHCSQPAPRDHPPAHCPGCGHPWQPVSHQTPADEIRGLTRTRCTTCGHRQHGRFPHCTRCGSATEPDLTDPETGRELVANRPRTEPLPVQQALTDWLDNHHRDVADA